MSAGIGRGRPPTGMFGYFMPYGIESPVPGLGTGRWHDPGGTLSAFGVAHNDPVTVKNQGTYYALAAGLNPNYFAGAFRSSGAVSPRELAETIWSLATRRERETIAAGTFRSRYKWVIDASTSPSVFRDLVWSAWHGRTAEQIARAFINKPPPASRGRIIPVTPDQAWRDRLLADLLRAAGQVCSAGRLLLTTGMDKYDMPAFLRKSADDSGAIPPSDMPGQAPRDRLEQLGAKLMRKLRHPSRSEKLRSYVENTVVDTPVAFIAYMEATLSANLRTPRLPESLVDLARSGLDADIVRGLSLLLTKGYDEIHVVAAFIHALTQSVVGESFGRSYKRAILKAWKQVSPHPELDRVIQEVLRDISTEAWNWRQEPLDQVKEVLSEPA
jgi:hypothetical protein